MRYVGGHGVSGLTGRTWRIAVLTAAGAVGAASQAQAALYYSTDSDGGITRPRAVAPQRQRARHHQGKKIERPPEKEASKPQGPLIISISIERQKLRIYDDNGFYAETPISTGMKGHPTPMGVFSVIQKQKLHHSNIYSGAPMPYMQRITWSGIAIHAGVLPGYPASHGCIRMPMAFAIKMWNWTRMGARVVVTPGEMTPSSFSHPLLATQKVVPQPVAADEPKADLTTTAKADKAAAADVIAKALDLKTSDSKTSDSKTSDSKAATSEVGLELRSTVGHAEQTRTADASGTLPESTAAVSITDATPGHGAPREQLAAATDTAAKEAVSVKNDDSAKTAASSEAATSQVVPAAMPPDGAKPDDTKPEQPAASADKPIEVKSPQAGTDIKSAEANTAKAEASPGETMKADAARVEAGLSDKTGAPKSGEISAAEKYGDDKPAKDIAAAPDVKKDQARPTDLPKAAAAKPEPAASRHSGPIAVFVSRKDAKLYVRKNFAPLFEVPVTVAPSDRPLGTHIFTAETDKNDANMVHWSVVTLPTPSRYAERRDEDERASRRRKIIGAVETKPVVVPDSPAEALDRLSIPADAMARIAETLSTGSSIIVSDQGIAAGETGEGTDFIVSLR
jgi:lipoprotein-anchoring transpeptidase ErfK/SrfK